jgi:hypothetical protein
MDPKRTRQTTARRVCPPVSARSKPGNAVIVAKRKDGAYSTSTPWLKIKNPVYSQAEVRGELFQQKKVRRGLRISRGAVGVVRIVRIAIRRVRVGRVIGVGIVRVRIPTESETEERAAEPAMIGRANFAIHSALITCTPCSAWRRCTSTSSALSQFEIQTDTLPTSSISASQRRSLSGSHVGLR